MRFLTFIISLFLTSQVLAFSPSDLRAFGKDNPVKLYLFTSLGCPHCADFHKNVLPAIQSKFVDTGKLQLIIVDVIRGENDLVATQAVRCLDAKKANQLETELYAKQFNWLTQSHPNAKKTIAQYAGKYGMSSELFELCISDSNLKSALSQQINLARLYGVGGTPTLVMREGSNVRKWEGGNRKEIVRALEDALRK